MKKLILGMLVIAFMSPSAAAKRGPKPEVAPIVYQGIEYSIEYSKHNIAILRKDHQGERGSWVTRTEVMATDFATKRELWRKTVYQYPYDLNLEDDVQWVFVKSLSLKDNTLIAINEKNEKFRINISDDRQNVAYNFKDYLGQSITLEGRATNAKLGALLTGDNFSIWVDDLESWPEGFYQSGDVGKRIKVTGTVIERYDLPVFVPKENEPMLSGIPVSEGTDLHKASHRYLLKDTKWEIVKENK